MGRPKQKNDSSDEQQVKFEATDHSNCILKGLKNLREKKQLFDVILVAEGQEFPAHRVVLASCSDYFRAMFTDGLVECQKSIINLNGVTAKGMKNLIDFAYSSKIMLDFDNVEDILESANHVQMLPVLNACSDFLQQHLTVENCIDMLNMTELFSLRKLKLNVLKFICSNWSRMVMSKNFCTKLKLNHFLCILRSDLPMSCSESEVLNSIVSWIIYDMETRKEHFMSLIKHVKMDNIIKLDILALPNKLFLDTLLSSNTIQTQFYNSCLSVSPSLLESGLINNRGYVKSLVCVGGFSPNSGMTNDLRYFNNISNSWIHLSTIPHIHQCNFGQAVLKNELFVVGGCFNDRIQEVVHQYGFRFNPQRESWDSIAPMSLERCRFYLGALRGKLFAIGGYPSAVDYLIDTAPCESYDPEENTWSTIAPLPGNRSQHAGVVHQDSLYISGGIQDIDEDFYTSFYRYDENEDVWTELAPLLTPRADHSMFVYNHRIYVVGGWYENTATQQRVMVANLDCYDIQSNTWETVMTLPEPRLYATYTLCDEKLHIIGGWINGNYQRKARVVEKLDMRSMAFNTPTMATLELWEHSSCNLYIPNHKIDSDM